MTFKKPFRLKREARTGQLSRKKHAIAIFRAYSRRLDSVRLKTDRRSENLFPMDPIKSVKLRWLQDALHDISYELSRSPFSKFAPQAWQPAINAYLCDTCIRICVDLAGVDRSLIELTVEPRRLVIRGTRELPEPTGDEECAQQLLAMEIDYGPFEREITFPVDVEIDKSHAEQRNGLLWISLPVRKES